MEHPRRLRTGIAIVFGLLTGLTVATSALADVFEIPFLTTRNIVEANPEITSFGDERSALRAGRCSVGDVELGGYAPDRETVPALVREALLSVNRVSVQDNADPLDVLQDSTLTGAPVLYVHGYNITFEKGCRRAALLQENASLAGRLVWYTWPSDGDVANYARDEADLYWSVPDLAAVMIELAERLAPDTHLDVIGHSLGGRGVALAVQQVALRRPDIALGEVVLLAPDMDFAIFSRALPDLEKVARGVTVYANGGDRPLDVSEQVHGYPRLGQGGNRVDGLGRLELIDVTEQGNATPSGHLYHLHNRQVGADLDNLINHRQRADQRAGLREIGSNAWTLRP
jgi:esterase/lipase superfamily enzyme